MGPPYLKTLIFSYLFSKRDPFKSIDLAKKSVIIDGYSLCFFVYYKIKEENKSDILTERITTTTFAYDGLSREFRKYLQLFKDKCANVCIVFDGSYEPKKHRKPDPQQESSVRFSRSRSRLPRLLHDQLISIVHDLKIKVRTAPGEADPVVVRMARENGAYIVARDTDYFLYEATKGYVPLNELDFSSFQGKCYDMRDVFQGMSQEGVALWATTIIYDFVKFDVLQKEVQMENACDTGEFRRWLDSSQSDSEKCQRLTCQYNLLRYIQRVGHREAFDKIFNLVPDEHLDKFKELLENYINIPSSKGKLTYNGNEIHPWLEEMYRNGQLDPDVIDILVRRQILYLWPGNDLIHLRLLLRMCRVLIKWDHSISNKNKHSSTVTFKGQTYNPLQHIDTDDLPSLNELTNLDQNTAKRVVLRCVDFALGPDNQLQWNDIHDDYKLSFCMFKLWLHRKTGRSKSFEAIFIALIISFLKRILLDTYDKTEERLPITETLPEKPYRQHSHDDLKSYFSLEQCAHLRESIEKYANFILSNEQIDEELEECQQFYKELSMVNQFFQQPFHMPPPALYFSRLTYRLAVRFSQSKNVRKDIRTICSRNQLLTGVIDELYEFFVPSTPSNVE